MITSGLLVIRAAFRRGPGDDMPLVALGMLRENKSARHPEGVLMERRASAVCKVHTDKNLILLL